MLTTSDAQQDVAEAYGAQANAYVPKPAELDLFIAAVRRVVEFWTNDNQLPGRAAPIAKPAGVISPASRLSALAARR